MAFHSFLCSSNQEVWGACSIWLFHGHLLFRTPDTGDIQGLFVRSLKAGDRCSLTPTVLWMQPSLVQKSSCC